jgi:hypothetical protein
MKNYILILVFMLLIGCEEKGIGTVSFGSNNDLLNCIQDAYVFVDGIEIDIIPGYCDSIIDCESEYTLNHTVTEGNHDYKIVIENRSAGTCYMEKTGDFAIKKDECIRVYYDVTQNDN